MVVIPALGFLGMYLIFLAVFSFDLLGAFQYVLRDAINFNTIDKRDYWIWVVENPKEFIFSAGIPVMILFIYLASEMLSQLKRLGREYHSLADSGDLYFESPGDHSHSDISGDQQGRDHTLMDLPGSVFPGSSSRLSGKDRVQQSGILSGSMHACAPMHPYPAKGWLRRALNYTRNPHRRFRHLT